MAASYRFHRCRPSASLHSSSIHKESCSSRAWLEQLSLWIDEECSEAEGRQRWNLYEAAMSWWWQRELDTAHLSHGPGISMWRTRDEVYFRWTTKENEDRGVPVFTVPT